MDLYHIPGDTGRWWRCDKFVEYQHEVPSIHYRVLGEYIKKYVQDKDLAVMMCWYMSVTYNEVTCILLSKIFNWKTQKQSLRLYCEEFWDTWKPLLEFGSSRKYAKNMDWVPYLLEEFICTTKQKPYSWLKHVSKGNPEEAYTSVYKKIFSLRFTGRFATDLFMESILYLQEYFGLQYQETSKLDWKNCSNLTSGILNIFYKDEEANLYDKTKRLPVEESYLTHKLELVQNRIQRVYPEQPTDINLFIGKICSFRNLFKAARYGGFHHDRELGWLYEYQGSLPEYQELWDQIFGLRKEMFDKRFLGEIGGWRGIRPERKKLWLREGKTGVEEVTC